MNPLGPADVAATAHAYVERLDDAIRIEGNDGHHLVRVRRLRAGEAVTAADGHGRWRVYSVDAAEDGTVFLRATSDVAHEVPLVPRLTVACALTKGERPEIVVQKLTELGVDAICLAQAARSIVRWDAHRERVAMGRLRRIAREAGAQCRRARLPMIDGPVPLGELAGRAGLVVADRDGVAADALPAPADGEWLVMIGPEGGLDDSERALFADAPRLAVGPFVLRAETAAIAAAAALAWRRAQLTRR